MSVQWEEYTPDFLVMDGALYLVDDASGYTAVYGEILGKDDGAVLKYASDDFEDMCYDHRPDRIALISEERKTLR